MRFLRYASSPKILYVDFVIVNNGDDKIVYKSETSIPLQDRYTYNDIENFKMKEILIHDVEIKNSVSFEIKKIKSNSKSFNIKKNDTNIYNAQHNSWIIAGAGNFAASMHIPSILIWIKIEGICSSNRISRNHK